MHANYKEFLPCCRRTVRKQNENEGRKFYTCRKDDKRCEFFQWKNEEEMIKRKSGKTSILQKEENSFTSTAAAPKKLRLAG